MGTNQSERDSERAESGKEIKDAIIRAQQALNRFDNINKELAMMNIEPEESNEYYQHLINVDMTVMNAYNRLRKFLKQDLPDRYWNKYIIGFDNGNPVLLGGIDGEDIDIENIEWAGPDEIDIEGFRKSDFKYIEEFQGAVERETVEVRKRFEHKKKTRTQRYPKVLSPEAYRRALRILDQARRDLGFVPEPKKRVPRTEITDEMIEEVERWRKRKLAEN